MKRKLNLLLFVCAFVCAQVLVIGQASQTRPRRVGGNQTNPSTQAPRVNQTPTRPPVLGGANRTPDMRRDGQDVPATPAGPEEVEAGDVIKVNTTLVTLPVSVMDRDGRYIPNLKKEDFRL